MNSYNDSDYKKSMSIDQIDRHGQQDQQANP
jgi:hypothetical protein